MIIEIAIGASIAAATYFAVRRRTLSQLPPPDTATNGDPESNPPAIDTAIDDPGELADVPRGAGPRGYRVGDVVLYLNTELWLAGVARLDETGPVMALFHAPGAERYSWVAQLSQDAGHIALLSETPLVPAGRVPDSIPIDGRRYRLERRGSATIATYGELPHPTAGQTRADFVHLDTSSGHTLIVLDFLSEDTAADSAKPKRLALIGERTDTAILELLPGDD